MRQLPTNTGYQANLIKWLKKNCETKLEKYEGSKETDQSIVTGEGAYFDLMYQMIYNITLESLEEALQNEEEEEKLSDAAISEDETRMMFAERVPGLRETYHADRGIVNYKGRLEYDLKIAAEQMDLSKIESEIPEDYLQQEISFTNMLLKLGTKRTMEMVKIKKAEEGITNPDPFSWFTTEDIQTFVRKQIPVQKTPQMLRVDKLLAQIQKMKPELIEQYYTFPESWQKEGLADFIRKNLI